MTASKVVKPSLLFDSAFTNAVSAAEPRGPMSEIDMRDLIAIADE